MRLLPVLLALAVLSVSGCDSGDLSADCDSIGARSGTISANVGGDALRVSCYTVFVVEGRTFLTGISIGESVTDLRTPITITIDGTTEGSYDLDGVGAGDDGDESFVQLALGGDATSPAESGVIRVETFTPTQLRGTFEFVTLTGVDVSDGRFDVGLSGVDLSGAR